jgi:hypothetical protein
MPINFSPYISLTPANMEPGDIYQQSIDVALTVLPEFNLRRGTLEDAIFQASAYMNALNIATINSLPSRLMEGFANLVGYSRFEGTRATVTLTVTAFDALGGVVPTATIFSHRYVEQDGTVTEYTYETIEEVDLAPVWSGATAYTTNQYVTYSNNTYKALQNGTNQNPVTQTAYWDLVDGADPSPSASIQAISKTIGYTPTITSGTELVCITTNNVVDNAFAEDDFIAGQEGDIDSEYLSGVRTHLQTLSNSLSTADHMRSGILVTYREIEICKVYDLTDPADLLFSAAAADGYVTAFVYGKDRVMTNTELASIDTFITNKSVPGLEVSIQNYNFAPFTIDIAITHNSLVDSADVEESIKLYIVNAFNYTNFPLYKKDITSNYIASIVFQAAIGVINVSSCTMQHTGTGTGSPYYSETANTNTSTLTFLKKGYLPLITNNDITITSTPLVL